jgi:hypothetical protein
MGLSPIVRRPIRVALGFLAGLTLLEVVLQAAAFLVGGAPRAERETLEIPPETKVVLCVGDSYTFGYGATTAAGSYPAQLQRLLLESESGSWKVLNHGWPGQNSRDVLRQLDAQLEVYRPKLVYVLVGVNDLWSHPALYVPGEGRGDEGHGGFRWRWRTGRLLALLWHRVSSSAGTPEVQPPQAHSPLVGDWLLGAVAVRFRDDGVVVLQRLELEWRAEGTTLSVRLPEGPEFTFDWKLRGDLLELRSGPSSLILTRGPPESPRRAPSPDWGRVPMGKDLQAEGWRAIRAGDPERAVQSFEALLERSPEDPWARGGLVAALVHAGRTAEADAHLDRLRRRYAENPDRWLGEALLAALRSRGDREAAIELARAFVEGHPESAGGWFTIAWSEWLGGNLDLARQAVEKALRFVPDSQPDWKAHVLRTRAEILRDEDPRESLRDVVMAFLLDEEETITLLHLQNLLRGITLGDVEECLAQLDPPASPRDRFVELFRRATGGDDEATRVLRLHLRQIAQRCRAAGAIPVFLSYPIPRGPVDLAAKAVAQETGASWIPMWPEFEERLATRRREDLFVPDGHCTDEGYGVVAHLVAKDALERLP